jgi:3-hydroxybutyryl-CoA dehydrogenase
MKCEDIKKVLIVGAGTMGQQIATVCVMHGFSVALYDVKKDLLDSGMERINRLLGYFVKNRGLTEQDKLAAYKRITAYESLEEAGADADLVSESIPEDPKLKGRLFAQLNTICHERTIFTTNTSTLLPSMFAADTGRPERFAALHFHDVRTTTIVDVMPHPGTSPETIALVRDFAVRIGQTPIMMERESVGYVFNFMLVNLFESALTLASNGVASIEDIDRSWMGVTRMMSGPFGIMDSVGLQTVWKVNDFWARALKDPQKIRNSEYVKKFVDQGFLGVKTGRGFYAYPHPRYLKPGFVNGTEEG